ncbi:MAG TPA: ATP-dependent DNA ligase [Nocardioidaceae bacterium]|nr:ATP-dependent DNA ligase [Nocardioidaceae bacterium]
MPGMLFADLVATSGEVSSTRSRLAKRDALAALLGRAEPDDIEILVSYLAGETRQRRTGIGWASLRGLPDPADEPSLTIQEIDAELERVSALAGPGSAGRRADAVGALFGRATEPEQRFLRGLLSGEIRQGALDSAMLDAVAAASGVPLAAVRRAAMLRGVTGPVARAALVEGADAVRAFTLTVGQPIRPMLASSAPDVDAAFDKIGAGPSAADASIDTKVDGIRIQVHKSGDEIRVFTRSLDEITGRLHDVEEVSRTLPADQLILDGEAITLDETGRPRPFQDTASRTATQAADDPDEVGAPITPFFFDVLHVDGHDLIDLPLRERLDRLDGLVPDAHRTTRVATADPAAAAEFFAAAVAGGQEGVVVKSLDAPYDAGRRGAAWVKVKPRHTLDLVVLAVEWGSGRRRGYLSNIHLGARDPAGGFVMLGKTFKGMTDEMLAWQTERFTELAIEPEKVRDGYVVKVHPEQVVEIAFDGLQRSTRYPGGVALRFARVLRYRDDKTATEADTISAVRALL